MPTGESRNGNLVDTMPTFLGTNLSEEEGGGQTGPEGPGRVQHGPTEHSAAAQHARGDRESDGQRGQRTGGARIRRAAKDGEHEQGGEHSFDDQGLGEEDLFRMWKPK